MFFKQITVLRPYARLFDLVSVWRFRVLKELGFRVWGLGYVVEGFNWVFGCLELLEACVFRVCIGSGV